MNNDSPHFPRTGLPISFVSGGINDITALTHSRVNGPLVLQQDTWATTRQISDELDISIYQARLILLDLVKYDLVLVSDRRLNKSLRWYPHASAHSLRLQPQQGTPRD